MDNLKLHSIKLLKTNSVKQAFWNISSEVVKKKNQKTFFHIKTIYQHNTKLANSGSQNRLQPTLHAQHFCQSLFWLEPLSMYGDVPSFLRNAHFCLKMHPGLKGL